MKRSSSAVKISNSHCSSLNHNNIVSAPHCTPVYNCKQDSNSKSTTTASKALQKLKRVFVRSSKNLVVHHHPLQQQQHPSTDIARLPQISASSFSSRASSAESTCSRKSKHSESSESSTPKQFFDQVRDEEEETAQFIREVDSVPEAFEQPHLGAFRHSSNNQQPRQQQLQNNQQFTESGEVEYIVVQESNVVSNVPPVMLPPICCVPSRGASNIANTGRRSVSAMRLNSRNSIVNAVASHEKRMPVHHPQRAQTPVKLHGLPSSSTTTNNKNNGNGIAMQAGVDQKLASLSVNVPAAPRKAAISRTESVSSTTSSTSTCSTSTIGGVDMDSLLFPACGFDFSVDQVVAVVERLVADLVDQMPRLRPHDPGYNEFGRDPVFKAREFCEMFMHRSRTSPLCIIVGMYYLRNMLQAHPKLKISSNNSSRLILVACAAAAKFVDDVSMRYTNEHWIRIGGSWLSLQKFNSMEREFMNLMEWNLFVDPTRFQSFCAQFGVGIWIPEEGLPHSPPTPEDR
eukprot:ANDGO_02243.mRNA.1 Cyclin-P4-1